MTCSIPRHTKNKFQGGTSGIGAAVVRDLAKRSAQIILLTRLPLNDPFLVDYIMDLRSSTNNDLISAEHVDLASLHSIRRFATKWVDNAPPRRLDMLILCAATMTPKGSPIRISDDGVESIFAVNYLANFHLLSILSPALRAQPPDRDVRVIVGTCSSYLGGQMPEHVPLPRLPSSTSSSKVPVATHPSQAYGSSKLALMTFAQAFQKHLSSYKRPDKQEAHTRLVLVDPGWCRTPGMRRWLTSGSLFGLVVYLCTWPLWWLILKSPEQGAQTFLHAAMELEFGQGAGGRLLKECKDISAGTKANEINHEGVQRKLWEVSDKAIEALEKEGAKKRANDKRDEEEKIAEHKREEEKAQEAARKPGSRRSKKA